MHVLLSVTRGRSVFFYSSDVDENILHRTYQLTSSRLRTEKTRLGDFSTIGQYTNITSSFSGYDTLKREIFQVVIASD